MKREKKIKGIFSEDKLMDEWIKSITYKYGLDESSNGR